MAGPGDSERQLALDSQQLRRTGRVRLTPDERSLELRAAVGRRPQCEHARRQLEPERSECEHVGGENPLRRERMQTEGDDQPDGEENERQGEALRLGSHTVTGSRARSSRTARSAAIASSRISGSGSWWLNFAHSKRAVKRSALSALVSRLRSARSMYSKGASDGRRGRPPRPSAYSMRAYAAMIARRKSGSVRRSSIDSSRAAATVSLPPRLHGRGGRPLRLRARNMTDVPATSTTK